MAGEEKIGLTRVAFLGLGIMGAPMAGHLKRAGMSVSVFNRTREKALRWAESVSTEPSCIAATPADAARDAEVVFACVGNDDDVRSITTGPAGAFHSMRQGAVFVDHTTTSAELARELALEAARRGLDFIDAPVSGGQAGAQSGRLTIMCGGDPASFARIEKLLSCYSRAATLMGPAGSGQLAKMVNQICIAGLLEGLAEGIRFGERAGLDMKKVLEVISLGAAQSWQMQNRGETMVDGKFDFGFAVEWMRKDLGICLDEAGRNGSPLPVAELVRSFYDEIQSYGGARWDTSSLVDRLRRLAKPESS